MILNPFCTLKSLKVVLVCSGFKRKIKTISSWEEKIIWGTTLPLSGSSNIFPNDKMFYNIKNLNSVQFSCSVMSDSLRLHGLQHARLPCLSPTPRAYSNLRPSSQRCHPTISSSVIPFSSHLQSFQHQGLFKWVNSSHQVAKVLEFQLQHQSFQWTPRTDFL